MEKDYLTVGELGKLMGVTVRTLQYYDKEDILKPSKFSEGGRRLYSHKDIIKLHQIISFKSLGFSLKEIKNNILSLETPEEIIKVLKIQGENIDNEIEKLTRAKGLIDSLQKEVEDIKEVDFKKYAEIIEMLHQNNIGYWTWKFFDEELQEHIVSRFGDDVKSGLKIFETYQEILEETLNLKKSGESPKSEKSAVLARKWWNMIMEFTGGDMELLPQLEKFNNSKNNWNNELGNKQKEIDEFINKALENYLKDLYKE